VKLTTNLHIVPWSTFRGDIPRLPQYVKAWYLVKHTYNFTFGVDGSWRKLHNDELHSLYPSPNIVRVIKSRRMSWAGHVARMGEGRGVYRVLVRKPKGKRPLERLGVGGRTTLSWILGR
jgi:hypothetical protein